MGRRAKVLILAFDHDLTLLVHLKLAGQVAVFLSSGEPARGRTSGSSAVRGISAQGDPHRVSFRRRHGRLLQRCPAVRLVPADANFGCGSRYRCVAFGPEGTGALDVDALSAIISRRSIPIKTLLLDQSFIAGLGNIYVDEVLFRSHIYPATAARDLSDAERNTVSGMFRPFWLKGFGRAALKSSTTSPTPWISFRQCMDEGANRVSSVGQPLKRFGR